MAHEFKVLQHDGRLVRTFFDRDEAQRYANAICGTVSIDNRFYACVNSTIKANAFDVIDYFSENRHDFDGLTFSEAFKKLYEECRTFLKISTGDDEHIDELAQAVDLCLTLEQRRISSYSQGNTHIEDYVPKMPVKKWQEYL